jgi:putative sigma-54 modulation protein
MPVRIDAKNAKLSDSIKEHVDKACSKFSQFFDRIVDTEVIIDTQTKHRHANSVEIIVKVSNQRIIGKGKTEDTNLFKAIDEAAGHVERQLKKYHDKQLEHR